ncbi:5-methylthioadenosine/S-adenosylhomocysteine deaminase [Nakamurella panacisegetis]|uniref:5-methylthioadenosine/S-adenosylhomocysteine deaminase n=1 Tax=Nakamurella panacisegetis TaxID=1090615 RepID=A0A1H0HZP3_9ACTN|nr:amidohydrolase [Nakamurella panacisegetis]SDO24657.1 5-methylthioadenosine/S-adenosylhomocysteine deaminase [Nakamurella panacisegetis]
MTIDPPGPLLIQGCDVLVVPESGDVTVRTAQDIRIDDGLITAITPTGQLVPDGVEILDGHGLLATPGLVNGHTHSPMVLFRGAAEDVPVHDWFNKRVWPMESNLTDRDVYYGALLACAEMISSGVTTFVDHYFTPHEIAEAVAESGIRADIAPTYFSSQGRDALEATVAFAEQWHGGAGGRVSVSMGPHAPYTVNDDDLTLLADHARRLGIGVHLHASENVQQAESSLARRGVTPIEVLQQTGILDAGVMIAHGCGILPRDYDMLAAHADRIAVASCPKVYLKHALWPLTPIRDLLGLGVTVAAGTDGAAGHNTLDVWEALRLVAETQKLETRDAMFLSVSDTLRLAMRGGAAAARLGPGAGALEPGQRADIALVDLSGMRHRPLHDPRAALVYGVQTHDVKSTVVAGRVLMRNRQLLTVDVPGLLAEIDSRAGRLVDLSSGASVQFYDP